MPRRSLFRPQVPQTPLPPSRPARNSPVVRRGRGGYAYRIQRPWLVPFSYLAFVLACAGLLFLSGAAISAVAPPDLFISDGQLTQEAALALGMTWDPAIAVGQLPTNTPGPSPTRTPRSSPTPWPTSTPSFTPSVTPIPSATVPFVTATVYLAIPAYSASLPTPVLPPAAPFPTTCDGPGRMNILLIGLDGGGGSSNYHRAARADAIAVLGINYADKTARLLSMPRDLWVPLPNLPANRRPEGKINTAYVWGEADHLPGGGPGYLSSVLAATFNLRIDRFAVVNFSAFEDSVDAIGGIDINVPRAIHDERFPVGDGSTMVVDIPEGWVHMDGASALIYGRTRHQDGDFARNRRQQAVLMAIRDKVLSAEVLPFLPGLAQALYGTFFTDLSFEDVALLGCIAPQIARESIQQMSIDQTMVLGWRSPNGESALLPQMASIEPMLQQFNVGQ